MLRDFRHTLRSCLHGRRSISASLVAVYFTTAAGIPLPTLSTSKSGEAYPCSDHACGCDSAEQCWRSCCCFTMPERFAWARRNSIRPPEFAIAAARESGIDLAWLGVPSKSSVSCCHAEADGRQVAADEVGGCCHAKANCCEGAAGRTCCAHRTNHDQKTDKKEKSNRFVAWQALGCHGHSLNWVAAVPSLVVVRPIASDEVVLVIWLGPTMSDIACPISSPPDVPPPERA
jgi:hypothetical protein